MRSIHHPPPEPSPFLVALWNNTSTRHKCHLSHSYLPTATTTIICRLRYFFAVGKMLVVCVWQYRRNEKMNHIGKVVRRVFTITIIITITISNKHRNKRWCNSSSAPLESIGLTNLDF